MGCKQLIQSDNIFDDENGPSELENAHRNSSLQIDEVTVSVHPEVELPIDCNLVLQSSSCPVGRSTTNVDVSDRNNAQDTSGDKVKGNDDVILISDKSSRKDATELSQTVQLLVSDPLPPLPLRTDVADSLPDDAGIEKHIAVANNDHIEVINNRRSNTDIVMEGIERVDAKWLEIRSFLIQHPDTYNNTAILGDLRYSLEKLALVKKLPSMEWDDSILSEAGGIWNAPPVNVKDSICYFSAAIQLMFRSFCHFAKKKFSLYHTFMAAEDVRYVGDVIKYVEPLLRGQSIPYDIRTSLRLARNAIADLEEGKKFKDTNDTLRWLISFVFWPECYITQRTYKESTGTEDSSVIEMFQLMTPDPFEKSTIYSLQSMLSSYLRGSEPNLCEENMPKRIDYITSFKFIVCITGDKPVLIRDNTYISWENEHTSPTQYGVIRGFILYHDKHYVTYMRSYKESQTRWICYDDDSVCLDAKEAVILTQGARVVLYDACDEDTFHQFINSHAGIVQTYVRLRNDIAVVCSYISSVMSFSKTTSKILSSTIYKYIFRMFDEDFKNNRGTFLYDALQYHLGTIVKMSSCDNTKRSIISFYVSKRSNNNTSDGNKFVMKLENDLITEIVGSQVSFDIRLLKGIINPSVAGGIWAYVSKEK